MQDTRKFEELPLGGTKQPARIRQNQNEIVSQSFTSVDDNGTIKDYLGAVLVNGSGCTFVKAVSPFYINPKTSGGGISNFVF